MTPGQLELLKNLVAANAENEYEEVVVKLIAMKFRHAWTPEVANEVFQLVHDACAVARANAVDVVAEVHNYDK